MGTGNRMTPRHDTVLLDVDGTLVDTTYHHALAWARAFRSLDVDVPLWEVHRAIGMGGDKLVAAVAGDEVEKRSGDELRDRWLEEYEPLRAEVMPLPGAADLVRLLKDRGFRVALASSGKPQHTEQAVELLGVGDLLDAVTTSEETSESKPQPSIPETALKKAGGTSAIMVGDSTFDIEAAARMHAPCVGVRTGGFGVDELEEAGAVLVADDPRALLTADWDALAAAEAPRPSS
jgi:HAD superfamily hydrolase (TIGR01549 family)